MNGKGNAVYDDGSGDVFSDKDLHAYMRKNGVEQKPKTEWFHITSPRSKEMYRDFRENRGEITAVRDVAPYVLRDEQNCAVDKALHYFK